MIEPDDAEVVPVLVGRHGRAGIGVAVRRLLERDDFSFFRLLRLDGEHEGGTLAHHLDVGRMGRRGRIAAAGRRFVACLQLLWGWQWMDFCGQYCKTFLPGPTALISW